MSITKSVINGLEIETDKQGRWRVGDGPWTKPSPGMNIDQAKYFDDLLAAFRVVGPAHAMMAIRGLHKTILESEEESLKNNPVTGSQRTIDIHQTAIYMLDDIIDFYESMGKPPHVEGSLFAVRPSEE